MVLQYRSFAPVLIAVMPMTRSRNQKNSSLEVLLYQCVNVSIGKKKNPNSKLYDPQTNQFRAKMSTDKPESTKKSLVQYVCLHPLTRRNEINVKLTKKGKHLLYKHSSTSLKGVYGLTA